MAKPILTQQYLKECLHYDPETGVFTWLERPRHHFKRQNEWVFWNRFRRPRNPARINVRGYAIISINYQKYGAHRLAFLYMVNEWPKGEVDHIDHCKTNNKWSNLRSVSVQENHRNMKPNRLNTSGFMGVSYLKRRAKWEAHITVNGKKKTLGAFDDIKDAVDARREANKKYGYHGNHGINP